MNFCPNINDPQAKALIEKLGLLGFYKEYIRNGYDIPSIDSVKSIDNTVDALPKIVDIFNKNIVKINQWFNNKAIDESTFYKKLQELGVPKAQLELYKDTEGSNPEEKLINFIGNYSYTVEINTAKENLKPIIKRENITKEIFESINVEPEFNGDPESYSYIKETPEAIYYATFNSEREEYYTKSIKGEQNNNSSYYSNLTVPGGTNYTENEIATPAITPSIKGHAQFSTDNGIGWFRSDDKTYKRIVELQDEFEGLSNEKVRRILEVQSDLFQKGRGKENLVTEKQLDDIDFSNYTFLAGFDGSTKTINKITGKEIGVFKDIITAKQFILSSEENQFLQLLNKDNNWVTFFVKSIIQDSAKKGYEKVVFPSGKTVEKIEGFNKITEELERINNNIEKHKKLINDKQGENIGNDVAKLDELEKEKQHFLSAQKDTLSTINFYENTVSNILTKTYGKVQDYSNIPIKNGVDNLFEENKELSKIGNKQLYSAYIDTIFPDSKIKDIVYHGSKHPNIKIFKVSDYGHEGISFTYNKQRAKTYAEVASLGTKLKDGTKWNGKVYNVIINALNENKDYEILDNLQEELIVFEPEQIHILGSEQDIEGFKEFVKESSKPKVPQITDEHGNTWNEISIDSKYNNEIYYDIEDKSKSISDLLFINKEKFSGQQQLETVKSIVYQVQSLINQGVKNVNEINSIIKNNFIETEAYLRELNDEDATVVADNLKDVIDNYNAFLNKSKKELAKIGLSIDGKELAVSEDSTISFENGDSESTYDSAEAVLQKLNYSDDATFSQSSKDNASGHIKLTLSMIPKYVYKDNQIVMDEDGDPEMELNHLNLPKFEDLDRIWTNMLYTLIDEPIGSKLEYLKNSKLGLHQVIYNAIISNPNTNIQNEFESTFSKQQANFITITIGKPTYKKKYNPKIKDFEFELDSNGDKIKDSSTIKVFDTNRTNANSFLIDNWYESFLQSELIKTDSNGDLTIDSDLGKQYRSAFLESKELLKTDYDAGISNIVNILNNLGISIDKNAFKESVKDENKNLVSGVDIINNKLPYFFDRLSSMIKEEDLEDSLEYNNPFINDTSSITLLAKLQNKANPTLFEDSFISGDGKAKYSFVNNTYLSHRIRKLKTDSKYLSELKKTPYASQSYWLNQLIDNPDFKANFDVFYTDTLGNDKTNQTNKPFRLMNTKEKEFTRVALFQNQGRGLDNKQSNIGYFVGLIPSDKTTLPIFKTLKVNVGVDKNLNFNSDIIDVIYDQFISEYNRVKQTQEQNDDDSIQKVEGYHGKNSAGNKFIVFRFLNKILLENNRLRELDDIRLALEVKPEIEKFLKELTDGQIKYWKSLGLYNTDLLDKSYKYKKGYKVEDDLKKFAADYAINQFVFMMNQTQLISGDPALHGKNDKGGAVNIDKTWINFYKRMAKDIAPGLDGNFKGNSYNTVFLKDLEYDSSLLNEYNEKIGELAQRYTGMNPADAQEYTTLQEHLDVLEAYGRLTAEMKEAGQRLLDGGNDTGDIQLILQPMKPVYVTDKIEDNINKMYYIKTSSFPLIPALTKGLEIDKLRLAMEANNIQRAVYESGVKLGLQGDVSIISKDGYVKFRELNIDPKQIINLDRSGFRIQQELPYHGDHTHITEGSQSRKMILNNVEDDDVIHYNGKDISGKEAKQLFEDLHIEKMNRAFSEFKKDIGFDEATNKITDLSKLEKILKEEAESRNYSINDIYSIQVIKENGIQRFKVPLGFTTNAQRFESILNSLVTNRVINQELPGFAKVQGSGAGFSKIAGFDETNDVVKSGIVWLDPNKGILEYTREKDGKLTGADILVPSWFGDTDMSTFIKEDGTLDTEKMPEELLTLIGVRIPTQGYNSMMKFRVKGFLPKYMGDLAIVPSEIVVQMGSDFDVDKLFIYRYNYEKTKNGFKTLDLDTSDLSKLSKEQLDNAIVKMFDDRLSDPKMLEQMLEPDGFGKLPEVANNVSKLQKGDKALHTFTTQDQNNIHSLNNDGKAGTGIFSLFSTFFKTAQEANLQLKQPIEFKNKKGDIVELSNLSTLRGIDNQLKSNVIRFLQSAAVDNAKEQILGKLNINGETMNVAGTMAMLGLDEEFIGYFLSQPVILNHVKSVLENNDIITGEYKEKIGNASLENNYRNNIASKYGLEKEQLYSLEKINYGTKELLAFLQKDENTGFDLTISFPEGVNVENFVNDWFQYSVFKDYLALKEIADHIRVIQSAINVDTKGLGASFTSMFNKSKQISELLSSTEFKNYPISNVNLIFSDNIINTSSNILNETLSIYSDILLQGSNAYTTIVDEIFKKSGLTLTDENLNLVYKNIKSYLLTSPDLVDEPIEGLRARLLYGKNNIAKRWDDYSKTKEGKNNILTKRIKPRFAKKTNSLNTIVALNTPASNNNIDIDNSMMYFYDMFENGTELEKSLAKDLVNYFIVTGAQYGPNSIGKYISYDILEKSNFSEKLRRIEDNLKNPITLDNFITQFFQNNPSKAKSFDLPKLPNTFVTDVIKELVIDTEMAGYFNVYDKSNNEFVLYVKTDKTSRGIVYNKVPVLANTKDSVKFYNVINNTSSSIVNKPSIPEVETIKTVSIPISETSIIEDYEFNRGTEAVLKNIIQYSNNEYFRNLASDLLSKSSNFALPKLKSSVERTSNGWYNPSDNSVSINFNTIINNFKELSESKFEEVFLHELLHAATVSSLKRFNSLKTTKSNPQMVSDGDFTKEQILSINGINKLFEEYKKSYPDQDKLNNYIYLLNKRNGNNNNLTSEELNFLKDNKSELYPLVNVEEFIAAGLTAENFRNKLKQGGFWAKLAEFFSNLLGLNKNDLDALYNSTISLLDTNSTESNLKKVNIQMQSDNISKILSGSKTTTTRSNSQANQIGLVTGESGIVSFNGKDFIITNRGSLTIDEAGGKDAIIKSEGVSSENDFIYQQTKNWVNGQGKLNVYDIRPNTNEDFDINRDEINRLTFVEQRAEFLRAYKKQIGSVVTQETLDNIKKYADNNSKYSNLNIWGWKRGDGKLELRISRKDPQIFEDIDDTPKRTQSEIFIDRILSKFKSNLQTLRDRQKQLGDNAPIELSVRIDKLNKKIKELEEKKSIVSTISEAELKIEEINISLNNGNYDINDLYEFQSYVNVLSTLNQHIQFSEDFDEYNTKLNNISAEAVKINKKLYNIKVKTINDYAKEEIDLPFDLKEELDKGLKDVGSLEAGNLDYSQSSSGVVQAVGYLIENAKFKTNQKHDAFSETFVPLVKEFLNTHKSYDILLQKDSDGNPTGNLINKYNDEFYKKSKGNFKFFSNNTIVTLNDNWEAEYNKDKKYALETLSEEDYIRWIKLNDPIDFEKSWKKGKKPVSKYAEKYLSIKPIDKWIDPQYAKLKALGENDPAVKFYNFIEPIIRKTNKKYGQQSNYIAEINKSTLDYMLEGNIKGGMKDIRQGLIDSITVELHDTKNEIDEFTGELINRIPVTMFSNKLTSEQKSYDLAKIVESIQYQEYTLTHKREIEPLLNIMYNIIQDSKTIQTKPNGDEVIIEKAPKNILDQSYYLIQSYLYNKSKDLEGVSNYKIDGKNIALSKATDAVINYVRIKGMAYNPFSAIGNIMQGLTSNFVVSAGGEYFNMKDNMKAFGTMLHSIAGRTKDAKKISKLMIKFDGFSKANELKHGASREIKNTQNAWNNVGWFELQERGEYFIQGQTLLGILYNHKIKVGDKEVSYYDAYDENGKWNSKYGEDPLKDPKEMFKFQQMIKSAIIDVHGNYIREIKNKKSAFWRAAMIFRTWLPQAINTRFGEESTDIITGKIKKGRYRSYNSFIRNENNQIDLSAIKDNILWILGAKDTKLSELDKINIRKNIAELALIGTISIFILGLKAALDDLDDEEKNYNTYVLNSLIRAQKDLTFFMLPSSYQAVMKDPLPLLSVLKDQIDMMKAAFATISGDPVYKNGPRKGKSKLYKEIKDNFPIITQIDKNMVYAKQVFDK